MGGGRQAWCPRCDEVRGARAGAACPVCGRQLLAMPAARPGQPRLGPADRVARRLRALAPAAGAVGVALLVLAVVASAFAAGRLTRTTPSAPVSAPTTTVAGFADEGSETGRRTFDNWQARASGMTVELRGITVGTGFTRLELHVEGVPRGREVSAIEQLRVRDRTGDDLLGGGQVASIATATSRPASDGGIDTEVVLDRPLDQQAVAGVELSGLTIGRAVADRLTASLVDPELQRRTMDSPEDQAWLRQRTSCPGCRLRVACEQCRTVAVTGSEYRRGRVVVAVEAVGPVAQSVLNPTRRRVVVTDRDGLSELPAWIDGSGGSAAITVGADLVTVFRPDQPDDRQPMGFNLNLQALAEQVVRGRWAIRQAGG